MNVIAQIKQPILKEMELFEIKFRESMLSKVALLNRITYYIVNRKGKQMRPMFVFLTAKMLSKGIVNERTYRGASVIELIHTATLVHDDVVDDSNQRRGFFSINALWKNKIAVLVGDYLLSKGLLLSIDNGDFDLLKIISVAVREMNKWKAVYSSDNFRNKDPEKVRHSPELYAIWNLKPAFMRQVVQENPFVYPNNRKVARLWGNIFYVI